MLRNDNYIDEVSNEHRFSDNNNDSSGCTTGQNNEKRRIYMNLEEESIKNLNLEFLWSDYAVKKTTPYGEVQYSHRYTDEIYVYRHVTLSRGVRKQAELIASKRPNGLLTEEDIISTLGIDMSCGWEHFMRFKGKLRELILRRPTEDPTSEVVDDGAVHSGDEVLIFRASNNSAEECSE